MTQLVKVAATDAVRPGQMILVTADGRDFALCNVDGRYHAVSNDCPHQGGPLVEGYLDGTKITCPWHSWSFDVTDGQCDVKPTTKLPCIPVVVQDGSVYLEL
jgi:nitrite reductase (NADH) small subunit